MRSILANPVLHSKNSDFLYKLIAYSFFKSASSLTTEFSNVFSDVLKKIYLVLKTY